jgi:signal transduction histidine kinase
MEGQFEVKMRAVNIESVFGRLRKLMKQKAQLKRIQLIVEILGSIPPTIQTDERRLMQVLINLSQNAIKYTFTGEVRVVGRVLNTSVLAIDVMDTGVGIKDSHLAQIFDMFHLVERKTNANETGAPSMASSCF